MRILHAFSIMLLPWHLESPGSPQVWGGGVQLQGWMLGNSKEWRKGLLVSHLNSLVLYGQILESSIPMIYWESMSLFHVLPMFCFKTRLLYQKSYNALNQCFPLQSSWNHRQNTFLILEARKEQKCWVTGRDVGEIKNVNYLAGSQEGTKKWSVCGYPRTKLGSTAQTEQEFILYNILLNTTLTRNLNMKSIKHIILRSSAGSMCNKVRYSRRKPAFKMSPNGDGSK